MSIQSNINQLIGQAGNIASLYKSLKGNKQNTPSAKTPQISAGAQNTPTQANTQQTNSQASNPLLNQSGNVSSAPGSVLRFLNAPKIISYADATAQTVPKVGNMQGQRKATKKKRQKLMNKTTGTTKPRKEKK